MGFGHLATLFCKGGWWALGQWFKIVVGKPCIAVCMLRALLRQYSRCVYYMGMLAVISIRLVFHLSTLLFYLLLLVVVDTAANSQRGGAVPSSLQEEEEEEVTVPEGMGKPPSLEPRDAIIVQREEKQEVDMKPQEDPKVKKTEPLQIKVKAENTKEGGRKASRPTRVVIHQTVLEPTSFDPSSPQQNHTSPLADDINSLEEVEAEMKLLMADLASSPGLPPAVREKQHLETTITSKEKGKVQVTISKPGKSSPPYKSHQMMATEWVTRGSPPPVLDTAPVEGGQAQLSKGTVAAEEELDTDARIHILEAELEELKKQAGMMGDEELLQTNAAPNWELEEDGGGTPPPEATEEAHSSSTARAKSAQQESEERKKNKEEELWSLFATIAESTKLPPAPAKEVTAAMGEDLSTSSNMAGNLHFSPATNQALADREAFLKEQMQQQRKTLNMEWQRLEEERQLLEKMRREDQSVETVKKVQAMRKFSWQDAVLQQQSGQEQPQVWRHTKEAEQGQDDRKMGGIDDDSTWLALQEQIQEEERQQQAEIERFEQEQRRRAEEERERAEEERQRVQLQWEEERKRQEVAKRRMEKEAAWILELEARKEQEKQQRAKEEHARRAEEERKRADKETAWIRDLEARKIAEHPLPAEESKFLAEPTMLLSRTPPSYSPPPMTEEQQRKAEAIRQFDEMIAQEAAKQQQQQQGALTAEAYNHFSQPLLSSPSGVRATSSPQVNEPQSYSVAMSHSYQHMERVGGTADDACKNAAVADVHRASPAHRTTSWREPRQSAQHSPAIKHSMSFQQPQRSSAPVCSVCSCPLGKEPCMSISNGGLSFHMRCFRCDVCHRSLVAGQLSVSILLREGKPHCRHCFSSSAGG